MSNDRKEAQTMTNCHDNVAVILLGHGSRVPDAGRNMHKVAGGLKNKYGYEIVEICYMSRLGPHFPEIFEKCIELGANRVMVIPYFLHDGLHLVLDIPEMMQEIAARYPGVKKYPVPPGQCEFVQMMPEEAEQYIRANRMNR
jgi:sirohydrochlorin ferrochelatase